MRNSIRYLPLAATNATTLAQEAGDQGLTRTVSSLVRDVNLYLTTPTETAQTRLLGELQRLREASVAYAPALANALANLLSHAEVLVAKQAPTEGYFRSAISNEISDLTDQLANNLEFELGKMEIKLTLLRSWNVGDCSCADTFLDPACLAAENPGSNGSVSTYTSIPC